MRILFGAVSAGGYGVASKNYASLRQLISQRMDTGMLLNGTLNVNLPSPYIVPAEASISKAEYNGIEFLKLQRCVVRGLRCVIVRPNTHEGPPPSHHGPAHVELMSGFHLTSTLKLYTSAPIDIEVEGSEDWWTSARWAT